MLACRIGDELFTYRDRCGNCGDSLAGAALHRLMGSAVGEAVLRCPQCRAHFDVVHAGAAIDENADASAHLDPIPLLVRTTFWRAFAPRGTLRSRKASGARCVRSRSPTNTSTS